MGARIELRPGQSCLFGYGSLCLRESMERSLGRAYDGPFLTCSVEGWRRGWDAAMKNKTFYAETPQGRLMPEHILYLNIRRQPGSRVNGVVFVVEGPELEVFDGREWIYDRVDVTDELGGVSVSGGRVFAYSAKGEFVMAEPASVEMAAIRRTYLGFLESAFGELGEAFRGEFERSTDQYPDRLVIDDRRVTDQASPFGYKREGGGAAGG